MYTCTYTTNRTHVHVHVYSTIRLHKSSLNAVLLFDMKDRKWQTVLWLKLKKLLKRVCLRYKMSRLE